MQNILLQKEASVTSFPPSKVGNNQPNVTLGAVVAQNVTSILDTLNNNNHLDNKDSIPLVNSDIAQHNIKHHDLREERLENLNKEAAKHAGHENQHLAMVLILITVMIISQILIVWWKTKYQKSYIHASMTAMYIIPFCISAYRHWWRFVSIWLVISIITIVLVWRPLMMPNFSRQGSTIPRLLYKWFFTVYSISSVIAGVGYFILLFTFFGFNILLNISPQTALDIGFMLLFYGIYYGVLCRDFTDFLVDKLAAQIGYYNPTSALPSKLLRANICAICGMDHGDKESIDMEGLDKTQPLLDDIGNFLDTDIVNPDQEVLITDSAENAHERIFVLTCGHKFHEYCIYGWCLVGKRQVCPFCREKVDLSKLFSALPFQKPHYLYGNLLDLIRYLFAW